jgi:hypothetical protein
MNKSVPALVDCGFSIVVLLRRPDGRRELDEFGAGREDSDVFVCFFCRTFLGDGFADCEFGCCGTDCESLAVSRTVGSIGQPTITAATSPNNFVMV